MLPRRFKDVHFCSLWESGGRLSSACAALKYAIIGPPHCSWDWGGVTQSASMTSLILSPHKLCKSESKCQSEKNKNANCAIMGTQTWAWCQLIRCVLCPNPIHFYEHPPKPLCLECDWHLCFSCCDILHHDWLFIRSRIRAPLCDNTDLTITCLSISNPLWPISSFSADISKLKEINC